MDSQVIWREGWAGWCVGGPWLRWLDWGLQMPSRVALHGWSSTGAPRGCRLLTVHWLGSKNVSQGIDGHCSIYLRSHSSLAAALSWSSSSPGPVQIHTYWKEGLGMEGFTFNPPAIASCSCCVCGGMRSAQAAGLGGRPARPALGQQLVPCPSPLASHWPGEGRVQGRPWVSPSVPVDSFFPSSFFSSP